MTLINRKIDSLRNEQQRTLDAKGKRNLKGSLFCFSEIVIASLTGITNQTQHAVGITFLKRQSGLLNYYPHRISKEPQEGLNNKIKTLKRQAYGFRDMEYFKLRLYDLHTTKFAFTGLAEIVIDKQDGNNRYSKKY